MKLNKGDFIEVIYDYVDIEYNGIIGKIDRIETHCEDKRYYLKVIQHKGSLSKKEITDYWVDENDSVKKLTKDEIIMMML